MDNKSIPPLKQSCAICGRYRLRTAALLFDRVHQPILNMQEIREESIPNSISFCDTAIDSVIYEKYSYLLRNSWTDIISELKKCYGTEEIIAKKAIELMPGKYYDDIRYYTEVICKLWYKTTSAPNPLLIAQETILREQADAYFSKYGLEIIPIYSSIAAFRKNFAEGNQSAFQAVLESFPQIDDTAPWSQILEFKKDTEALSKIRRLRTWVRDALKTKSIAEATDIVNTRVEDYKYALKKHALEKGIGAFKMIIPLATGAGIAGFMDQPFIGILIGGAVTLAQGAMWGAEYLIDKSYVSWNNEISIIQEIENEFRDHIKA